MAKRKIDLEEERETRAEQAGYAPAPCPVRDRQTAQIILLAAEGIRTGSHRCESRGNTCDGGVTGVKRFVKERLAGPHRRTWAWPQAFIARCGGQESAGDSNASARQPGTLELPHYGASGGISKASVQRLWAANDIKPHLTRTFKAVE